MASKRKRPAPAPKERGAGGGHILDALAGQAAAPTVAVNLAGGEVTVDGRVFKGPVRLRLWVEGLPGRERTEWEPAAWPVHVAVTGDHADVRCQGEVGVTVRGEAASVSTQSGSVWIDGEARGAVTTVSGDVLCTRQFHHRPVSLQGRVPPESQ